MADSLAIQMRPSIAAVTWQNHFYSCPVEAAAVCSMLAYIELNPVRAGLAPEADHFVWSSAQVHTGFAPDRCAVLDTIWWAATNWESQALRTHLLTSRGDETGIRLATFTGRTLGSDDFVRDLQARLRRTLARQKPGPKAPLSVAAAQTTLFE